jgi:hypothetical protein
MDMALARLRRSARVIAVVLLASFWGVSHGASDDACALGVLQAHDESKHVIRAPGGSEPQHCAICHSLRTPRRPIGPIGQLVSTDRYCAVDDLSHVNFRRAPALDNLPARAPPACLT